VCWAEWENEKTSVDVITSLEAVLETVQVPVPNPNPNPNPKSNLYLHSNPNPKPDPNPNLETDTNPDPGLLAMFQIERLRCSMFRAERTMILLAACDRQSPRLAANSVPSRTAHMFVSASNNVACGLRFVNITTALALGQTKTAAVGIR